MTKTSLLLADVDGTLVSHEKELTPRAVEAVRKLRARGIGFAITSGRPPRGMAMLLGALALDTPIAGFNGGSFVDPDMKMIEEHIIAPDLARAAVARIAEAGLDVWLYSGQDWFVHKIDAPHVDREQRTVQFPPTVLGDFGAKLDRAIKIVGVSDDHDAIAQCAKSVQAHMGARVSAALSQPYYLDVTHPDANKGFVVGFLSRRLNIPPEEIATIGDMPNDVLMFEKGGLSIAMGNAEPDVQKAADVVTGDCDHEGFADAVERFILAPTG